MEERAFARWAGRYADGRLAIRKAWRIGEHFSAFADAYGTLANASLFLAACYLSSTQFTPCIFIAFLAAYGSLQAAFQGLSSAVLNVVALAPDWERGKPVLEAKTEFPAHAADPGALTVGIEITGVSFGCRDGPQVLRNVSIARLAAGDILGEMSLGEMSLVEKRPPTVSVTAATRATVLAAPQMAIQGRLETEPGFAGRFYRALAEFLSDRRRAAVAHLGYGGVDEEDALAQFEAENELDEGLLDNLHVAGDRMRRLTSLLRSGD